MNSTSNQIHFSKEELDAETNRLFASLSHLGWTKEICQTYASLTLEINLLKKEKNAIILAHNYQLPEIIFGVSDFVGDSYQLSKQAAQTSAETIIFSGVRFMAETAKMLSPKKKVLMPSPDAGCSLAESISAQDVINLRKQHPDAAVVTYINTYAEVKAESDVICTSNNALKIIESLPNEKIIFLPDKYMAQNLAKLTKKQIIGWEGLCVVHEEFSPQKLEAYRRFYPEAKILVHTECSPAVVAIADLAGGTGEMQKYVSNSSANQFMIVTECGLSDKLKVEFPKKKFIPSCGLCPHMKRNDLRNILKALKNPSSDQFVEISADVARRAQKALDKMLEFA
ncbi:quinolinate synthase NadA [Candidatus Micrarchaeota archaeon]|nr:quinolinate synthase NadA [Candidatus Micrarchaeota archaeon]